LELGKNGMKTDELIATLAKDVAPVRPLPSPAVRARGWSAIAVLFVIAGLMLFGTRPNLGALAGQAGFIWTTALATATIGLSVLASLILSVPGAERSPELRATAMLAVGLWAATLTWSALGSGPALEPDHHWPACFARIMSIGLVPAVMLVTMIRQAAPLKPRWTFGLAFAGAVAVGALAIQFICPLDAAVHALRGHLAPVLAAGFGGAIWGTGLFSTVPRRSGTGLP
jgi:hypothetical protein